MNENKIENLLEQYILGAQTCVIDELMDIPTSAVLILQNTKCNLACDYCLLNKCDAHGSFVFDKEKIAPQLAQYKGRPIGRITLWGGEPTFNKEIYTEVCDFINQELPSHIIAIYTNGILLDDWWADFFKDHKVKVTLSHDGPGQKYRGPDYFESPIQSKAIKKMYDNGNLIGVSSVIHKYNNSFYDINNYFDQVEKRLDIKFNKRNRVIVGATLDNKIIYDFDYMDPLLIKFITESFEFLFKQLITGDKEEKGRRWFTEGSMKTFTLILRKLLGLKNDSIIRCKHYQDKHIAITNTGEHRCIYDLYHKIDLPPECKADKPIDPPLKCRSCEINEACPIKGCLKLSIDDNFCKKVILRYKTIEFAIKEFLKAQCNFDIKD